MSKAERLVRRGRGAVAEWLDKRDAMLDGEPCEYGHFGCSTEDGGACGNELDALLYHCRCCGEVCLDGRDCCTDEFPEPGDLREWS